MRVLIFVLLFPFVAFAQNKVNIDFEFVDQEPQSVKQNARLELGLTLPDTLMMSIKEFIYGQPHQRTGLNPFVSWELDIKAHFKHRASGEKFTAIGFWYTEVQRNTSYNRWNYLHTELPFRVRYAPPKTGEWEVYFEVDVKGMPSYFSAPKTFNVVSSTYKGHVTYNKQTEYLERDGRTIIPTGVNLPFPSNKNNLMYSIDKEETLNVEVWEAYHDQVKRYIDQGGEYFRMFLHPSSTEIEFEEVGYYHSRQNFAWEIDRIIDLCEESNTLIQLDLMYHSYFMKLGDYHQFRFDFSDHWYDEKAWPFEDRTEISGYSRLLNTKTPSDMFLSELGMRYLKERARYIMARWGYSTSISNVELLCEPWHINENPYASDTPYDSLTKAGDIARKAIYEYHKQMSSFIKDSIQYNQKLLSAVGRFPAGKSNIYSHYTERDPDFIDSTWYLDEVDMITISYYSKSPEKMLISKTNNNNECGDNENSMACTVERLKRTYGKPVIMGEFDHGDDTYECSDYQGHYIDVMRSPYNGLVGHYVWAAFAIYDDTGRNEEVSWPRIIAVKNYFNSDWFLNTVENKGVLGRQKEKFEQTNKDIVETQYIVTEDKSTAAGYVYNRTFNINTAAGMSLEQLAETPCALNAPVFSTPLSVSWKPQRMHVQGLQSFTKYRIVFYSYVDHAFIFQAEVRSSILGRLKLVHPVLIPEKTKNPLIWYRIEKMN